MRNSAISYPTYCIRYHMLPNITNLLTTIVLMGICHGVELHFRPLAMICFLLDSDRARETFLAFSFCTVAFLVVVDIAVALAAPLSPFMFSLGLLGCFLPSCFVFVLEPCQVKLFISRADQDYPVETNRINHQQYLPVRN